MTTYDELLKEVKAKAAAFRSRTAQEYILPMYEALRNEELPISPEDARDRIEKDCVDIWEKRTILKFLPAEAKDLKKQKAGRLGQKKRKSAAVSAAQQTEKKEIMMDTKGRAIEYSAIPDTTLKLATNDVPSQPYKEVEFYIDRQEIVSYALMLIRSQKDKVRFHVTLDRYTFRVISASIVQTPEESAMIKQLTIDEDV